MKKEFIPYEQALALKELGFDEPCLSAFFEDKIKRCDNVQNSKCDYLSAPLYQQAFRWFREKYGLIGWVNSKTLDDGKTIYIPHGRTIPDTINKNLIVDIIPYVTLKTFEEAELECLKKLIQIVKEK